MPRDRVWCPDNHREPSTTSDTESPNKVEPVVEAMMTDIHAQSSVPVYSESAYVYLFKLGGRWRIGPDYRSRECWLFTNSDNGSLKRNTTWYSIDEKLKKRGEVPLIISKLDNISHEVI